MGRLEQIVMQLAQRHATGCLEWTVGVPGLPLAAGCYFSQGLLEYASVHTPAGVHEGMAALAVALVWSEAEVEWEEGARPPMVVMEEPIHLVMARLKELVEERGGASDAIRRGWHTWQAGREREEGPLGTCLALTGMDADFRHQSFTMCQEVVLVGRDEACDVHIPSEEVSGRHAMFTWEEGSLIVEDLSSTNGVWVNGARVQRAALYPGDRVDLGRHIFLTEWREGLQPAEPASPSRGDIERLMHPTMVRKTVPMPVMSMRNARTEPQPPAPPAAPPKRTTARLLLEKFGLFGHR